MKQILNAKEKKQKINRRKFLKLITNSLLLSMVSTPLYSFFLERYWIDIKNIKLSSKHVPKAFSGIRIVQISDFHLGFYYTKENLMDVVNQVNNLKPDILCFTGDLIEDGAEVLRGCVPILSKLQARLGKIAILGNHDYRAGKQDQVIACLKNSGFIFLKNSFTSIKHKGEKIYFAGLDDLFGGHPNIKMALTGIPNNEFTILLAHEPDLADMTAKYPVDIQLSGHSHGGQIRIPLFGPLFKPDGAKKYMRGLKRIPQSSLLLYVNRGIGTTYLPFRFNCRPEITIFTLHH